MKGRRTVTVIGGGISGLSVAWWLNRSGIDVRVFEKGESVGGTMQTTREDGWLVEKGPNSALETTPLFAEMIQGLGIGGDLRYANPSSDRRYILRNGSLHALPVGPGSFLKSDLWSTSGKLRLLKEPFVRKAEKEESVAEFVERRIGREFLDYAINPFVAGVYAGRPETLSVREAFPKLYALEKKYGGLIKGMIRGRRERGAGSDRSKGRSKMFSFRNGMETFPRAIGESLGSNVFTGCRIDAVDRAGDGSGFEIRYDSDGSPHTGKTDVLVLSTPAHAASEMLNSLSPDTASAIEGIFYPPVAEVFLGFRRDQVGSDLDGFGFLVPEKERRMILGTIWSSSIFEGRAPADHVALTTFMGGSRQPELLEGDDDRLRATVLGELNSIMKVSGDPVFTSITRWKKAIPQYAVGYSRVLDRIDRCETDFPGLFICSNYRGGIAVGDCLISARKTADRVLKYLDEETPESQGVYENQS